MNGTEFACKRVVIRIAVEPARDISDHLADRENTMRENINAASVVTSHVRLHKFRFMVRDKAEKIRCINAKVV